MKTTATSFVVARDDYLFLLDAEGERLQGRVIVFKDGGVEAIIVLLRISLKVMKGGGETNEVDDDAVVFAFQRAIHVSHIGIRFILENGAQEAELKFKLSSWHFLLLLSCVCVEPDLEVRSEFLCFMSAFRAWTTPNPGAHFRVCRALKGT